VTRGRVLAGLAVAVAVAMAAAGCSSDPPDPFAHVYSTGIGPWPARPGWQLGYLFGDSDNISAQALTIQSVSLAGPGVGTVVKVTVMIAPLAAGTTATVSSAYTTDLPVQIGAGGCHKQKLEPPKGYKVNPGGQFRIWAIVTALMPGRWNIPQQVVTYTQDGGTYQHVFPIRYWGNVTHTARMLAAADPDSVPCVKPEGARYLHYYRR
jgi:hypothetical protein